MVQMRTNFDILSKPHPFLLLFFSLLQIFQSVPDPLRSNRSYVNERYDEARGRLEALGVGASELQICKEKMAGCLEELCEVLQMDRGGGGFSTNGNDRGLIEHTL